MIRKGRSVSVPPAPHEAGRPRDGQESRDARKGDRGFGRSGRDVADARDSRARDPRAVGGPLEPFEQFDEFESSFGEFESAADALGADRFERTSAVRGTRTAGNTSTANAQGDRFERSSEARTRRSTRAESASGDHFERSSEARARRSTRTEGTVSDPSGAHFERSSETRADRGAAVARTRNPTESQRPGRSLKGRALAYLSRREYSRAELSRKLMPFADDADALEALLDSLVREGWLSDARFAESVIHRRAARLGATRIVGELRRHAMGDTLIEEVNAQLRETELSRARAVWQKKYGQLPETPAERARQARFLAARGFSMTIIGKILKGIEDDWP